MAPTLRALTGILFLFSFLASSPALIVGQADGSAADPAVQGDSTLINDAFEKNSAGRSVAEFSYWHNVGTVGLGTGTYIGDGWVITAAHVGCFPFVTSAGTVWKPDYATYKVLHLAGGTYEDIAIFRLAGRPDLPAIPLARTAFAAAEPAIIIGNGYTQEQKSEALMLNGRAIGTLGFYTRPVRAKFWGMAYSVDSNSQVIASRKGARTRVFATRFERKPHAAQATDGDSGSPAFIYNPDAGRWELAGCITSVSHASRYVPYGSKSFIAPLPTAGDDAEVPVNALNFDAFEQPAI